MTLAMKGVGHCAENAVLSTFTTSDKAHGMSWTASLLPPFLCFCLAALSRYVFRWTQSRFQIAAFLIIIGILWGFGHDVSSAVALACAIAAGAGVVMVKILLEGINL